MKSRWLLGSLLLGAPLLFGGPAAAAPIDLTAGGPGDVLIKFNNYESFGNLDPSGNLQIGSTNFGTFQVTSILINGASLYSTPSIGDTTTPYLLGVFSGITVSSITPAGSTFTTGNTGGTFQIYQVTKAQLIAAGLAPNNLLTAANSLFNQGIGGYGTAGCAVNTQCYHGITDVGGLDYLDFDLVPGATAAGDTLSATLNALTVPITGSAGGFGDITGGAAAPQFKKGTFTTALGTQADIHFADEFCPNGSGGQCATKVGDWANESFDPANAVIGVPEPASLSLLGGALLWLGIRGRGRRKTDTRR